MTTKSPDAFRTISEVADWLGVPTHVLRFWESRFSQVKPVKRAGGRRYYRPADMELLGGIRTLLHDDGMTIRGVQKLLRESGVKHVAEMSPDIDNMDLADAQPSNVIDLETASTTDTQDIVQPGDTDQIDPTSDTAEETIEEAEIVEPQRIEDTEVEAATGADDAINVDAPLSNEPVGAMETSQGDPAGADETAAAEAKAPDEPDIPQQIDISHISIDPVDDEADVSAAQEGLLNALRAVRKNPQSPVENTAKLGAMVLRLTLLKTQMEQGRTQA